MNVADIKPVDIITRVDNFDRAQATGLNCLIFLAVREQTTVNFQYEEIGFDDIPKQIVMLCDRLDDDGLLEVARQITVNLLEDGECASAERESDEH